MASTKNESKISVKFDGATNFSVKTRKFSGCRAKTTLRTEEKWNCLNIVCPKVRVASASCFFSCFLLFFFFFIFVGNCRTCHLFRKFPFWILNDFSLEVVSGAHALNTHWQVLLMTSQVRGRNRKSGRGSSDTAWSGVRVSVGPLAAPASFKWTHSARNCMSCQDDSQVQER